MILAKDADPGRAPCSGCSNMILLGYTEPLFKDNLETTSGPCSAKFEDDVLVIRGLIWDQFRRLVTGGCVIQKSHYEYKKTAAVC